MRLSENILGSYKQDHSEIEVGGKLKYLKAFTWAMTGQINQEKANIIWQSGSSDEKSMLEELGYVQK